MIGNLAGEVTEESYPFALKTDATSFENSGRLSIFARAVSDDFNTYRFDVGGMAVPTDIVSPIPLPASFVFVLSGLGIIAGFTRHKVQAGQSCPVNSF